MAPGAFGHNYWDWTGLSGAPLLGTESLVTPMHVTLLRAGGHANDANEPVFDHAQIDQFVAYARVNGAEPDLQVPILGDGSGNPATAQLAADMVTYANVTSGYGIKYWSIGNEPDLYATDTEHPAFSGFGAADYCNLFREYVTAMKAVDPSITILGPEVVFDINGWLPAFLDGCADVVDIVTFHHYPFGDTGATKDAVFNDVTTMRSTIDTVQSIEAAHGAAGKPIAITEEMLSWEGDPNKNQNPILQNSFEGALWVADALGVGLETGLATSGLWSLAENSSCLGFIQGLEPVPAYYSYKLLASHMSGAVLHPSGVPTGFSVYASHDSNQAQTSIAIMEVPMLANDVDAGPMTAQFAADMVTYVNGTQHYGVKYWTIGDEADYYTDPADDGA